MEAATVVLNTFMNKLGPSNYFRYCPNNQILFTVYCCVYLLRVSSQRNIYVVSDLNDIISFSFPSSKASCCQSNMTEFYRLSNKYMTHLARHL